MSVKIRWMLRLSATQWKGGLTKPFWCVLSASLTRPGTVDFWLFPKAKVIKKDECFESFKDTEAATTGQLKTFEKEDFENCSTKW